MKTLRVLTNSMAFFAFILVVVCIGLLGISPRSSAVSPQDKIEPELRSLKVANRTESFEFVSAEKDEDGLVSLSLKNSYDRPITAFQISVGSVRIAEEFIYNEARFIAPGALFKKSYPLQPELIMKGFTILAVVFDDGVGDGEPPFISEVTETRSAAARQFERFLPLLRSIENTADADLSSELQRLKTEVLLLPDNPANQVATYERQGLRNGKQRLLEEVTKIEYEQQKNGKVRELVREIEQRYQKISLRLKGIRRH